MESIPYNPRLSLGNIVDDAILENVQKLSKASAPVEIAQDKLNALILAKRSLDMTVDELKGLEIDTSEVEASSAEIGKEIRDAAKEYASAMIKSTKDIVALKIASDKSAAQETVGSSVESPLDFDQTTIKALPLGANSLKLDAQYFSSEDVSAVNDYVAKTTELLGPARSAEIASAATKQTSGQYQKHKIEGTLVITASCTHKVADVLYPCVLDADNAIETWNAKFPKDKLDVMSPGSIVAALLGHDAKAEIKLLSGASYGSSFVGMAHLLQSDSSQVTDTKGNSVTALAEKVEPLLELSAWLAAKSGDIEAAKSLTKAAQKMMSKSRIDCHCSIVCMGVVPSPHAG